MPIEGEVELWGRYCDLATAADVANIRRHYAYHGLDILNVNMSQLLDNYHEHGAPLPQIHPLPIQYPGGGDPLASASDDEGDDQHLYNHFVASSVSDSDSDMDDCAQDAEDDVEAM